MRKDYRFTAANLADDPERWQVVKEVMADYAAEHGDSDTAKTEAWLQDNVAAGMIEVTANMEEALDADDDYVSFEYKLTPSGEEVLEKNIAVGLIELGEDSTLHITALGKVVEEDLRGRGKIQ